MKKTIVITGGSSGIGKETAIYLARQGHKVYTLARRLELMEDLKSHGIIPLKLDVTDSKEIQKVVQHILEEEKQIHALVNNAGYGYYDALEIGDIKQARNLFDVNVFGLVEMIQAVLPNMRQHREGCIVNISSVVGKVAFPYMGWYSASKHAVEGLSDALRLEVEPFNIKVSIVEPGRINSEFGKVAFDNSDLDTESIYKSHKLSFQKLIDENPISADTALSIARAISSIVNSSNPKTRYVPNIDGKVATIAKRFLGDRIVDWAISSRFK